MKWVKYEDNDCFGIALCNYQSDHSQHMSLALGDFVCVLECFPGWYRGYKFTQPCVVKVFPKSAIKILTSEPNVDLWAEVYSWIPTIRDAYSSTFRQDFDQVNESVQMVINEKRADSLADKPKIIESNRRAIVQRMEVARRMMGLPIESRNERGDRIDLQQVSIVDLYMQHQRSCDSGKHASGLFEHSVESTSVFIKLLNVCFERMTFAEESIDVLVSLYRYEDKRVVRISETYMHRIAIRMNQCDLVKANAIVTKDITFGQNQRIFLVFHFIRIGPMDLRKVKDNSVDYRRPKGIAVSEITNAIIENQEGEKTIEIHICTKEESLETFTIEQISNYRSTNRLNSRNTINIQLKIIRPEEIIDRNIVLLGLNPYYPTPIRVKRNCLYVTLLRLETDRGAKKSDPNCEVVVSLRDARGEVIKLPRDEWREFKEYRSTIYYHNSKPRWNEAFCIPLFNNSTEFPPSTHLCFMIRHRSLNNKSRNYGVTYLKLFPKENCNAIVSNKDHDKSHELLVLKIDENKMKTAEYLNYVEEGSSESINMVGKKGAKVNKSKSILYVQTLLCSNEYTFDELLAGICCNGVDRNLINYLETKEIGPKNIDVDELKKFALKILEASLQLLQQATTRTYLGKNILSLLSEMFNAVKNLPDYQAQLNRFINETMHFNVHQQILQELIDRNTESDLNYMHASDWFMKIVVKSYKNSEHQFTANNDNSETFKRLTDSYLEKLERLASSKVASTENTILRRMVLKKAGPIISALIPVCRLDGMARLVNNLLKVSSDLDALAKSDLIMDTMKSSIFLDRECRKLILSETTENMIDLFRYQLNKIFQGRDLDKDYLLDNICEKMLEFIQIHENTWINASKEYADEMIFQLLFEQNMLRSCTEFICNIYEYLLKDELYYKLLYKPLMVLVTVLLTCLSHMNMNLWQNVVETQADICNFCKSKRMTNNYDLIYELLNLIHQIQLRPVFPESGSDDDDQNLSESFSRASLLTPVASRISKYMKQAWVDMLFVQSNLFMEMLHHIHCVIIKPYYLRNILQIKRANQGRLCCCHPSEKLQINLINKLVEAICSIIVQPWLKLDELPGSAALRMMHNASKYLGDIRYHGALRIKEIWHDLEATLDKNENLKNTFSPTFFTVFSKMTTIQNYRIRLLAVECMFDIVHLDPTSKRTELITQIDQAMEKADSDYCEEMERALKHLLANNPRFQDDSKLVDHIIIQMNNIQECTLHLSDNSPINGMIVINNLRKFYQNMGRSDIIGRYLFKLLKIHSKAKNDTEMGYTLLELASFYKWSKSPVTDVFLPPEYAVCECEHELKAKLLEDSLKHFEKEDWEQGVEVCKELINGYANFVVDYVKLSESHIRMAELLKKIMFADRIDPNFYIIFYIGKGFPKFITELPRRSIVLRTQRSIGEISSELNAQFKDVKVERKFPDENDYENDQSLKIFFNICKTSGFEIPGKYESKNVKQRILRYYESYNVSQFVYKKLLNPIEEDAVKKEIIGNLISTDGKLPNILSVVPVKTIQAESIDPFTESSSDLESQLRKDEMLLQDYEMAPQEKRESMSQKLKDNVLKYYSPVSGGITKIVEMIPPNDSVRLTYTADIVTHAFSLIYHILKLFEIYPAPDQYKVFLLEFNKLVEKVGQKLDIGQDEFNTNILLEQYTQRRQDTTSSAQRRPSYSIKISDETHLTLPRKYRGITIFGDGNENVDLQRSSWNCDDAPTPTPMRPRADTFEPPPLVKRPSVPDMSNRQATDGPPLPPKPGNRCNSMFINQNPSQPPPKPPCFIPSKEDVEFKY